jgi:hypothetical protein
MPLVQPSHVAPFANVDSLGIAVCSVPPIDPSANFALHSGFLYKTDNDGPRIVHLAWHHKLWDEAASDPYLWADVGLDPVNRRFVASWLADRRANPAEIPYGIDATGVCFDAETQDFIPPPVGKGLTCSTYVLAVFRHLGFPLLAEDTWPSDRAEDASWQEAVVVTLRNTGATAEHVAAVEADKGARRFRPAEVVGAATVTNPWPVGFADASQLAAEVISDVQAAAA